MVRTRYRMMQVVKERNREIDERTTSYCIEMRMDVDKRWMMILVDGC